MNEEQPDRAPSLDPTTETARNREDAEDDTEGVADAAREQARGEDEDIGGGGDLGG